jgi:3-deoxy-D-arabino-heptulosonate 7-phosphate synthase
MKRYKNSKNEIFAYEDDISEELLNQRIQELGLTPLTQKELEELNKPKEISLAELKLNKLASLNEWATKMTDKSAINLKGFGVIDGGYEYLINAAVMKNNYEWLPKKEFRMYNDEFVPVTLQDLERIEKAIGIAGIFLKNLKWQYESAISKANSKEELEAISFNEVIEIDLDKDNK